MVTVHYYHGTMRMLVNFLAASTGLAAVVIVIMFIHDHVIG